MRSWFDRLTMKICTKSSNDGSRRKPFCLLSSPKGAETATMLFWALMASEQITMRKVDGWQSLNEKPSDQAIDLAA